MSLPFILWNNLAASATITVTDTAAGFDKEHLKDWRNYTFWKANTAAAKTIDIDLGSAQAVDTLIIYGHNLATAGADVTLASSATGAFSGEQTTRVTAFEPATDGAICKTFSSATVQHWRISIGSSPSVAPQIAIVALGAKMEFPFYPDAPLDYRTEEMNITRESSKGGYLLGHTTYYTPMKFSLNFTYFPLSWVTANFDPFWTQHGKLGKPFFIVPNITAWATDCRLVRLPENYNHSKRLADLDYLDQLTLQLEGVAE